MKIGIVGGGVVGRATARAFIEHAEEVRVYDVVKERRTHPFFRVIECDLIFVCLPTPSDETGSLNTSAVEKFFQQRHTEAKYNVRERTANFVLRSTVPIGTTRMLVEKYGLPNLVHSPEFLTARCSIVDAQLPARNIVGQSYGSTPTQCGHLLTSVYKQRFPGVPCYYMTSDESEAVKLFQNSFFAVKVAFWNEMWTVANKLGLDWDRVMEAILADGRVDPSHTKVPGPDGKFGYGGACLTKDISGLISQMEDWNLTKSVCDSALFRNEFDRERSVGETR